MVPHLFYYQLAVWVHFHWIVCDKASALVFLDKSLYL